MGRTLLAALTVVASLVVPAAADDPGHDPVLNCWLQPGPDFSRLDVVIAGEAHSPLDHDPAVSISLTCRTYGGNGLEASGGAHGPVVTVVSQPVDYGYGPMWVCASGSATYAGGDTATVPERCVQTACTDTNCPWSVEAGPAPNRVCAHTRGPSPTYAWVVVAAGWATRTDDVPMETYVSCTLTPVDGEPVAVQASALGGIAVASGQDLANVGPLASKCVVVTVTYRHAGDVTNGHCDNF